MLRFSLYLFLVFVLLPGCVKEYSQEGNEGVEPPASGVPGLHAAWEFRDEGNLFSGPTDSAVLSKQGSKSVITISGPDNIAAGRMALLVTSANNISASEYSTSQEQVRFSYEQDQLPLLMALPFQGGDIQLTITAINDREVSGTFLGIAKSADGRSRVITDGKFSAPLKLLDTVNGEGSVIFWTRRLCNGVVRIRIGNTEKAINRIIYEAPICGDSGFAQFSLKPGDYTSTAFCGVDSSVISFSVKSNNCTAIEISFPIIRAEQTDTKPTDCRIKSLTQGGYYSNFFNTEFNGNTPVSISMPVDVYQGMIYVLTYFPVFSSDRIQVNEREYFLLDAKGRISEFHGYQNPNSYMSTRVVNRYFYSSEGLLDSIQILKATDLKTLRNVSFKWSNDRLILITDKHMLSGALTVSTIEYYNENRFKYVPWVFEQVKEIFVYQSLIDYGGTLRYPVKSVSKTTYDEYHKVLSETSISFDNYVVDANDYLQAGRHEAVNSQYLRYSFRYHCP